MQNAMQSATDSMNIAFTEQWLMVNLNCLLMPKYKHFACFFKI